MHDQAASQIERFPDVIADQPSPIFQFNKAIIDATADLVCAYKPQFAHSAAYEAEDQLERTIDYIQSTYPGIPVILDSKRGDVGNTAERYAIEAFERYHADAVTVSPYLGGDAPNYADYIVFGAFQWARVVSPFKLLAEDDPVHAWREKLLDAFDGMARKSPGHPL